jgi:hypothetical protein
MPNARPNVGPFVEAPVVHAFLLTLRSLLARSKEESAGEQGLFTALGIATGWRTACIAALLAGIKGDDHSLLAVNLLFCQPFGESIGPTSCSTGNAAEATHAQGLAQS